LAGAGIAYLLTTEKGKQLLADLKLRGTQILDEIQEDLSEEAKAWIEKLKTYVADTTEQYTAEEA